ncbi:LysR family transcriptional regulator [Thalassospira sp.]|uniref:LysR family transcriptional regulator n=1 Tax=Thalassospira sp. TaxID=1912094 RepID=UPI000C3F2061|nr:LysR family transcriptional regulator [Thalassospira sp.]MBC05975.1 transcriptional regulator [Thalassospira sp.]|tara:strand:- start:3136 stop:4053 length:918 start_codon:yes stop_codon:yes gene_type:complete
MKKSHESSREYLIARASHLAPVLAAIASENSFSKAAEKLGVHQSAVSHRITQLEEALGFALFERTTRQITPTEYGRVLCAAAIESVDVWDAAFDRLEKFRTSGTVRLSVASALAMKWVLPNLASAQQAGLEIALDVNDRPVDFSAGTIDAAIRFGVGPYPGLHSSLLKKAEIVPVASPGYCAGDRVFEDAVGSPDVTLLKDAVGERDGTDFSWGYYAGQAGVQINEDANALAFDRADLVLQAAINGMGIGLGRTLLIEGDIAQGFLKAVGKPVPMKSAYWLVCSPEFAKTERHGSLLGWLKTQMK